MAPKTCHMRYMHEQCFICIVMWWMLVAHLYVCNGASPTEYHTCKEFVINHKVNIFDYDTCLLNVFDECNCTCMCIHTFKVGH